jgi:hypothetical protein
MWWTTWREHVHYVVDDVACTGTLCGELWYTMTLVDGAPDLGDEELDKLYSERWKAAMQVELGGRGLHSSTFRLNTSTFCGIRWVHEIPPVY